MAYKIILSWQTQFKGLLHQHTLLVYLSDNWIPINPGFYVAKSTSQSME